MLKTRDMDTEPRLPIAYGAAVEVLGQVEAKRGAGTDASVFLERERDAHADTSVVKRIQKNINLLGLEGTMAPGIVATEYLGPGPPSMEDLEGKVALLCFWAHWCSDCKAHPGRRVISTDTCVPISRLADCLLASAAEAEASGLPHDVLGHVGDGNFHFGYLIDPDGADQWRLAESLNHALDPHNMMKPGKIFAF